MTSTGDDDRLLAEVAEALRTAQAVPPAFIEAGKAAFAWHTVDDDLATLAQDSAAEGDLAGAGAPSLRTQPPTLRSLSLVASGLSIELDVTTDALLGQVVPPRVGRVELQCVDGTGGVEPIDEVGWFSIQPKPAALFRLRIHAATGPTVTTEWLTP
jgi:hypothetical protein